MPKTYERIADRGRLITTAHYGSKGTKEETTSEDLEVRTFDVEPAFVKVNVGFTINLGNYNSGRVDASVTLPCYAEEIDKAFEEATDIAGRKAAELIREVEEFAGENVNMKKALARR